VSFDQGSDSIGARLAKISNRFPGRTALVEGPSVLSYRDLDSAATTIAHGICGVDGAQRGRVCLFFDNKIPAIKSIFGVSRSAHAYVPLDASDPEARLQLIVADCEPIALLTEERLLERARAIAPEGCAVIDVARLASPAAAPPLPEVAPDSPLYLYYTSGSTGRPKAAIQTHRNLLFFADAYSRSLNIVEQDRLSFLYTLSFNAASMDIYGALLNGAALCAYDLRKESLADLADWLDRERVTILHTVPTVFRELGNRLVPGRVLPHLRAIDLGGEAVFAHDIDLFRAHTLGSCIFINQLASTEVSLIAQHVVRHASAPVVGPIVPVGHPPQGIRVEIRGEDGRAARAGEAGEIVVSGRYLSPGYWRRPELDAAVFSADPIHPGSRRYVSSDFGFVDAQGNLNFLGRKGGRVKVRGHSVELMEVEAALAACPGVAKAAVLAAEDKGQSDSVRLVAYVVADAADRDPQLQRRRLAARVPSYMLPAVFVFMDELPLTASGKIDRLALAGIGPSFTSAPRETEPPRGATERAVAGIFAQLLNLPDVGRGDDFFILGGDSLLGVELQIRIRNTFGVRVASLHRDATVAGIAACIDRDAVSSPQRSAMPVLFPLWAEGDELPLFLVHGRHGQAFVSPHFMRLLGDNQPVSVFQARGLDGLHEPHTSVDAMATDYLAEMRKQRPRGPYFIGALCAGAYIAAAMARSLRDDGEVVLPLLLLDPPDQLREGGYSQMSEQAFTAKMTKRRAMGGSAGPMNDPAYMKALLRVALTFDRAIAKHRPQAYDGPVYVLSSRQRIEHAGNAGLHKVFTGEVKRYEVGSTHADALDPRNPLFASYLLRCLGLIRAAGLQPARAES
jgi:amino acid adenylation domain-containing protein